MSSPRAVSTVLYGYSIQHYAAAVKEGGWAAGTWGNELLPPLLRHPEIPETICQSGIDSLDEISGWHQRQGLHFLRKIRIMQ